MAEGRKIRRLRKLAWKLEDALAEQRNWGGKSGHSIGMRPSAIHAEQKRIDHLEAKVAALRDELGLDEDAVEALMEADG